ncbi:hypothetical protein HPB50_019010 [Hyalomma asiaticum]|uniref:Uncharacterized protein n=1 Tax=Hyalomma asiaticum TaxID=266040 RepID=A0ACB7T3P7_HYAAI|nr:hypothetical protein HPB50_019010 [Hyalomma asiaticum]
MATHANVFRTRPVAKLPGSAIRIARHWDNFWFGNSGACVVCSTPPAGRLRQLVSRRSSERCGRRSFVVCYSCGRASDRREAPYKFYRRIKDAPRKPRRGATSHEERLAIVAAVADNPRCSAQEIKVNFGLKASKSTVKRRLYQAGLKSRTEEQKVLLRTANKDKRLQFAQRHAGWIEQDWKKPADKFQSAGTAGLAAIRSAAATVADDKRAPPTTLTAPARN